MTLKQNLAESAPLLGVLVAGFGMLWLGMQNIESHIRSEISSVRSEISSVRSELSGIRTELSTLAQRVARIEGRLNIPAPTPSDHAAADPTAPPPDPAAPPPVPSPVDG